MQETKSSVISALIGLIGACNNNPKTDHTDQIIINALAFPLLHPEAGADAFQEIIAKIHREKYEISPGCAQCVTPCGNTSDYDTGRIDKAPEEIRSLKLQLLSVLEKLAVDISTCQKTEALPAEHMEFFYRALSYISYDLEKESYLTLLTEAQAINYSRFFST